MQITLGQQYNVGEKPTVILYIYINRHLLDQAFAQFQGCVESSRVFRVEY